MLNDLLKQSGLNKKEAADLAGLPYTTALDLFNADGKKHSPRYSNVVAMRNALNAYIGLQRAQAEKAEAVNAQ